MRQIDGPPSATRTGKQMAQTRRIGIFSEAAERRIRFAAGVAMMSGCLLLPAAPFAAAQSTTADIVGTVTDAGGAIIANATVTLTNLDTKEIRTVQSTGSGDFDFAQLGPGNYSVQVKQNGFKTFEVPSIALAAGDRAREDAKLDVGAESQTVQVTAQTPALQTDTSVVEQTVTEQSVQDLPLSGRNYINLVQITPGANEGPGNGLTSGSRPDDRRQTSAVVANGQSEILNNQTIDGLDNNERIIGGIGVRPSIETIREINVQTNNYTAEVGRTGGAVVNIITKSGTNAFHGSAYEFFQNDVLNANPFQFTQGQPKPKQRQNQFGGSFGGPVVKDKVFFFAAYEGLRQVLGSNPTVQQTVLPNQYNLLHSGNNALISQQLAGGAALDPVGLQYAQLYPLANVAFDSKNPNTQGFTGSPVVLRNSDTYDGRVDWQIDPKDLIYGRYTHNNVPSTFPGLFPTVNQAGLNIAPSGNVYAFYGTAIDTAQNAQINFVRTISPSVLLQFGFGYTRVNNQSLPLNSGLAVNTAFGQPRININQNTSGLGPVFVNGYGSLGDGNFIPIINIDNTFQEQAALVLNRGKQSIKIGAALIRRQSTNVQNNFGIGNYNFTQINGNATALSALLTGNFNNVERSNSLVPPHYRDWEPSVYVQDDYHATQNLTLNLGIRYDVLTPFTEATANALTNFDPVAGRLLVADRNGVNNYGGVNTTYSNVAPRIGFAVTPKPGLVVRGGFGISYFQSNYTSNSSEKAQPFVSDYRCNNGGCAVDPATGVAPTTLAQGLPVPAPSDPNNPSGNINDVLNANFRTSYIEGYNLGVEKSFGANVLIVNYVGNLGRHLAQITNDQNAPAPISNSTLATLALQEGTSQATAFNLLRPYHNTLPNVSQIGQFTSTGASSYNALQISLNRRTTAGLTVGANYTLAHGLDNVLAYSNEVNDGYGLLPTQLSSLEYGNSDLDLRNRLAVTANYELPFGKNLTGYKAALGKGWQGNTLLRWQSGLPFTVLQGNGVASTNNAATTNSRPNQLRKAVRNGNNINQFFDVSGATFAPQASGTVGSERRNPLYGPHYRQVDVSLFKSFPVYRESTLEFRAEAFNAINTTNFGQPNNTFNAVQANPNANATSPAANQYVYAAGNNVGEIQNTSANYVPRQIQFALKYQF
jgi:hypothetical protein